MNLSNLFTFNIPLDIASAVLSGVIALLLVLLWEWLTKPRLLSRNYKFKKEKVNFGTLYKIEFKICGLRSPGFCEFQIHWDGKMVRAKWDDLPNPVRDDNLAKFEPTLVPQTFFLPLMIGQKYTVPIVHEDDNGELTIFSGWWFGRRNNLPYGPDPKINEKTTLKLILKGNNLSWSGDFTVEQIINNSKHE